MTTPFNPSDRARQAWAKAHAAAVDLADLTRARMDDGTVDRAEVSVLTILDRVLEARSWGLVADSMFAAGTRRPLPEAA